MDFSLKPFEYNHIGDSGKRNVSKKAADEKMAKIMATNFHGKLYMRRLLITIPILYVISIVESNAPLRLVVEISEM